MSDKDRELLERLEQVEKKSRTNPRKVYRVSPGFYFLTVDDNCWSVSYCSEINRWCAYSNNLEADETFTKKQMIDCLLS